MNKVFVYIFLLLYSGNLFPESFVNNHGDDQIFDSNPELLGRGISPLFEYSKLKIDNRQNLYVNLVGGNLVYKRLDYYLFDIGIPLIIEFTYNSGSTFKGRYGNNWQFSYNIRYVDNNFNKSILLIENDDRCTLFDNNNDDYHPFYPSYNLIKTNDSIIIESYRNNFFTNNDFIKYNFFSNFHNYVSSIEDRNLNKTFFIYNSEKQLVGIKLPSGRSVNLYYKNNLLERISIPEFGEIKYYYDELKNLIKVEHPNGAKTNYEYESTCNFLSQIINEKDTFSIEYKDFYVDKFYKNSSEFYYEMKYDFSNKRNKLIDKFNKEIIVEYDTLFRVTKVNKFGINFKSIVWDSLNRIVEYRDPMNEVFNYAYSNRGLLTNYYNPKIQNIKFLLDSTHQSVSKIEINNSSIEYELDKNSNVIGTFRNNDKIKNYKYDSFGQLIGFDFLTDSIQFLYDGLGNYKRLIINNDLEFSFKYNINNDLENITEIGQFNIKAQFDYFNNKVSLINNYDFRYKDIFFNNKLLIDSIKNNNILEKYFYDNSDRLVNFSSNTPYYVTFKYTKDSSILINSSLGNLSYTYDYKNFTKTISDKNKLTFAYDFLNRLKSKSINDNIIFENKYNTLGRIIGILFPDVNSIDFTYDDFNRIIKIDKSTGNDYQFEWDNFNRLVHFKENNLNYIFNHSDKGYSLVNPSGKVFNVINNNSTQEITVLSYFYKSYFDRYDRLEQFLINNNQKLKLEYFGNKISKKTINDNWNLSYIYNDKYLLSEIIENGVVFANYNYDEFDRLIDLKSPYQNSKILYNDFNRIKSIITKGGKSINFDYTTNDLTINVNGNDYNYEFVQKQLISVSNKNFDKIFINLNNQLLPIKIVAPEGVMASLIYNQFNKISSISDSYNNKTFINYSDDEKITGIINKNNFSRTFVYNSDGLIINYIDFDGSFFSIQYTDWLNIYKIISSNNDTASYDYDLNFKTSKFRNFDGSITYFEFDANNNLIRLFDLNDTIFYNYNFDGKLSKINYNNKYSVNYNYSQNKILNEIIFNNSLVFKIEYDNNNLLKALEFDKNKIINIDRDINENIIYQEIWNKNPTTFQFNEFNQKMQENSFYTKKFNYDKLGRLIQVSLTDGSKESYFYDLNSRLALKNDFYNNSFSYSYDKMNNVILMTRNVLDSIRFGYNNLNKLVSTSLNNNKIFEAEYTNGKLSQINSNLAKINLKWLDNKRKNLLISNNGFGDTVKFDDQFRIIENTSNFGYDNLGLIKFDNKKIVDYDNFLRISRNDVAGISALTYDSIRFYPFELFYKENLYHLDYNKSNKISTIKLDLDTFKINLNNYNNYLSIAKNQNSIFEVSKNEKGDYTYFIYGLNKLKKASNVITSYGFDSNEFQIDYYFNKNIKSINQGKSTLASFSFDENSNLILSEDAAGNLVQYSYFNNLINEIDFSNGKFIKYEYDAKGNVKKSYSNSELADSINFIYSNNRFANKKIKLFNDYIEIFEEDNEIKVLKNNKAINLFQFIKDSIGTHLNLNNQYIRFLFNNSIESDKFKIKFDKYNQTLEFEDANYFINNEISTFGKLLKTSINSDTIIDNNFDYLNRINQSKLGSVLNLLNYDNLNRLKSFTISSDNYDYIYSENKFFINDIEFSTNSNKSINRIIKAQDTTYLFYDYEDRLTNFINGNRNIKLYYNSLGELSAIIDKDTTLILSFKIDSIDGNLIINESKNLFDLYLKRNGDNQHPIIKFDVANSNIEFVFRNSTGHPILFIDKDQKLIKIDTINLMGLPNYQLNSFRYSFKDYFFIDEIDLFIKDAIITDPINLITYNKNLKLSLQNLQNLAPISVFDVEGNLNNLNYQLVLDQNELINNIAPFDNKFTDIIDSNKSEFIVEELNRLFNNFDVFNLTATIIPSDKPDIFKLSQIDNYLPNINKILLNMESELQFVPIFPDELYDSTLINSLKSNKIRDPKLIFEKKDRIKQLKNLLDLCEVDTNFILYKKLRLLENIYDFPTIIYPDNIIELELLTPDLNDINELIDPNSVIKKNLERGKKPNKSENILYSIFNYLYIQEKNNYLGINKPHFIYNDIKFNNEFEDKILPLGMDLLNMIPIHNFNNLIKLIAMPFPFNYLPSKHLYNNNYIKLQDIDNNFNENNQYILEKSYQEIK